MTVTAETIKEIIRQSELDAITGGDESVIDTCIRYAEIYAHAYISNSTASPDEETRDAAVVKLALAGLYRYASDFDTAQKYQDDGQAVLYEACGAGGTSKVKTPSGAVVAGSDNWNGY
jgi:hypothetical protein